MVRTALTRAERERGERFGALLREARGQRSMVEIAAAAGLSAETLRKIEAGRIATPAFFTVAALAGALGLSLDLLADACAVLDADGGAHGGAAAVSAAEDAVVAAGDARRGTRAGEHGPLRPGVPIAARAYL
ncbi:XRE family transcriptional regulator (modular protein) [Frankia canadensis]|uniref:XRE family transcriptional regulator (Modular protein) n=1 Tax=Frankia canadensis TaxID=1836972 RepID=A0A2I2KUZ7_9ACTN|nr:XRE family transcriptional regulator (modular protein) [Frankia canadensis]SOU56778.1 XRE family transcriptional regulator (modular protein) [Frankia canadensis]